MNINPFSDFISFSYILFFLFLFLEFRFIKFKKVGYKWLWLFFAIFLGYTFYFFFQTFKRKMIVRRKFSPQFNIYEEESNKSS